MIFLKNFPETFADSKISRTFASLLKKSASRKKFWRDGRVVDCGGLENRCTARYRGFESLSLRQEVVNHRFTTSFFWYFPPMNHLWFSVKLGTVKTLKFIVIQSVSEESENIKFMHSDSSSLRSSDELMRACPNNDM